MAKFVYFLLLPPVGLASPFFPTRGVPPHDPFLAVAILLPFFFV